MRKFDGYQYKGPTVEKIVNSTTKKEGNLRLDKKQMTFFAFALNEDGTENTAVAFADKDGKKVKDWLTKQLGTVYQAELLTWVPVIEISNESEGYQHRWRDTDEERGEELNVRIDRFYLALTLDQRRWLKLEWKYVHEKSRAKLKPEDRAAAARRYGKGPKGLTPDDGYGSPFRLPSYETKGEDRVKAIVEFTPELWTGLMKVVDAIKTTRGLLKDLLDTDDGMTMLTMIGSGKEQIKFLPAPTSDA